jgi:hypothetical protein
VSQTLCDEILTYLEAHNTMTLGTCRDGAPWAATVFYSSAGLDLYFISPPDSRHCQNLAANPRVAVTIQEDYRDWRKIKGIQLEGKVEPVEGEAARAAAIATYSRKYPEVMKLFTDPGSELFYRAFQKTRFYRVVAERVFYIDNERGFGRRQEWIVADRQ